VPTTSAIQVRAATDSASTGSIDLMPLDHERIARRDLVLGRSSASDASARGAIAGTVTGVGGKPLANALVIAEAVPETRTTADGHFMIRGVPAGTRQIEVRAID